MTDPLEPPTEEDEQPDRVDVHVEAPCVSTSTTVQEDDQ